MGTDDPSGTPDDATRSIDGPGAGPTGRDDADLAQRAVGSFIGPYRLLSVIGDGGFGVVYLAERRSPHIQRVALKVIKPGMDSKAVIARFEQERQALAMMDHPNVASVFDGGISAEGRPYFVMELVQGESITTFCDRQKLGVRARLELMVPVCEAVQHAHMKGIIHRDLKPSNVLVQFVDGRPIPKVIDFGVAKAISHTLTEHTVFTERGQIIGTPEYMSPEQAEMGAIDVDTRTDVYSLGVVLYELLVGAVPFDSKTLRRAGYDEIRRFIREVEPPKPSTRLSGLGDQAKEVAARRSLQLGELLGQLRRELEWIPLKALRKDRQERYRAPQDLADDIRNYLEGRPLSAGPVTMGYRAAKFIQRHRAAVMLTTGMALVVVTGVALVIVEWRRATVARDDAESSKQAEVVAHQAADLARKDAEKAEGEAKANEREAVKQRDTAEAIDGFLMHELVGRINPEVGGTRDLSALRLIQEAAQSMGTRFSNQPLVEARLRLALGNALSWLDENQEAIGHLRRAVELSAHASDEELLVQADAMRGLAWALIRQTWNAADMRSETAEAVTLMERVHAITKSRLGPQNPVAARDLGDLAFFRALGSGGAAAGLDNETLDMLRTLRGRNESVEELRDNMINLAVWLDQRWKAGQHDLALSRIESEVAALRRVPEVADRVAWGVEGAAFAAEAISRTYAAEALRAYAVKAAGEMPATHPIRLLIERDAAHLALCSGRAADADLHSIAFLNGVRRIFRPTSRWVSIALALRGAVLVRLGRPEEALPLAQESVEAAELLDQEAIVSLAHFDSDMALWLINHDRQAEAAALLLPIQRAIERTGIERFSIAVEVGALLRATATSLVPDAALESSLEAQYNARVASTEVGVFRVTDQQLARQFAAALAALCRLWDRAAPGDGFAAKAERWEARSKKAIQLVIDVDDAGEDDSTAPAAASHGAP